MPGSRRGNGGTVMTGDKQTLREHYLAQRRRLSDTERLRADAAIRERIRRLPEYRQARLVAIYAGDGTEPDLLPLTAADPDKRFFLPRYVSGAGRYELAEVRDPATELRPGRYKLAEPAPECPAATPTEMRDEMLFLIPGVAFDEHGVRLGRGGGYYDRLLAETGGVIAGVFYAAQQANALPEQAHDRRMDLAVTEEKVWFFHDAAVPNTATP